MSDLLKVLDMTEEEQAVWLYKRGLIAIGSNKTYRRLRLADLAFRLRDEAEWVNITKAMQKVYIYWCNKSWKERRFTGETRKHIRCTRFWVQYAKPIHWIIAALIA